MNNDGTVTISLERHKELEKFEQEVKEIKNKNTIYISGYATRTFTFGEDVPEKIINYLGLGEEKVTELRKEIIRQCREIEFLNNTLNKYRDMSVWEFIKFKIKTK